MNDKKMTAVEWLYFELWKQTDFSLPTNLLDKAKEMEKEQIIEAWIVDNNGLQRIAAEQYYKETYER